MFKEICSTNRSILMRIINNNAVYLLIKIFKLALIRIRYIMEQKVQKIVLQTIRQNLKIWMVLIISRRIKSYKNYKIFYMKYYMILKKIKFYQKKKVKRKIIEMKKEKEKKKKKKKIGKILLEYYSNMIYIYIYIKFLLNV